MPKQQVDEAKFLEEVIGEGAEESQPGERAVEQRAPAPPPNAELTGAVAIMTQTKAHVEKVTQYILSHVKDLRGELDEIEGMALEDLARVNAEIDGHIIGAEAMVRSVQDISRTVQDIKAKRAKLITQSRR